MSYQFRHKGLLVAIDQPARDAVIAAPYVHITGWVASTGPVPAQLRIGAGDALFPVRMFHRPDVAAALPGERSTGFEGLLPAADLHGPAPVELHVRQGDAVVRVPLTLRFDEAAITAIQQDRPRRLQRLATVLACPHGCSAPLVLEPDASCCPACGTRWPRRGRIFDMREEELRRAIDGAPAAAVSSNGYDPIAWSIIRRLPQGLILDNGAGLRAQHLPNVINLEICDLPTTDVMGVGEHLPFRDNSFDAVFSLAVLEHVRDPFACAREIARVLKPGGVLYAAVPFLQPFHGYPDHYYNMTSHGLRNLFAQHLRIDELGVPASGKPFWALNWILRSYVNGLPADVAQRFRGMTVDQLLGDPLAHLPNDYVTALSPAADEELACVNYLLATKPA